ncbi:MAG: DUF1304 domain-containing protein [Deltaproteobacteria bacterium]|nr:DUF1304 domain-containing protein [Deltaproteobacteria bacterium]
MTMLANVLVVLVALLHLYFLVLEMFLWTGRQGRRLHGFKPEMAQATAPLAANQGLYNGFLAAGLLWGLYLGSAGFQIVIFFLICVLVAGIYGAWSVSKRIFYVQALPAALALALVLLSSR